MVLAAVWRSCRNGSTASRSSCRIGARPEISNSRLPIRYRSWGLSSQPSLIMRARRCGAWWNAASRTAPPARRESARGAWRRRRPESPQRGRARPSRRNCGPAQRDSPLAPRAHTDRLTASQPATQRLQTPGGRHHYSDRSRWWRRRRHRLRHRRAAGAGRPSGRHHRTACRGTATLRPRGCGSAPAPRRTRWSNDVSDPDAAEAAVGEVERRYGALDILVLNAGGPPPGRILDVTTSSGSRHSSCWCSGRSGWPGSCFRGWPSAASAGWCSSRRRRCGSRSLTWQRRSSCDRRSRRRRSCCRGEFADRRA